MTSSPTSAPRVVSTRPVAVSGLGSIGTQHLRAFAAIGCPTLLGFDPDPRLRDRAAAITGVSVTDTFDELLHAHPRALVIATPDHLHLPQLDLATAAGTTSLVEKPLAASLSDSAPLVARIAARNIPVLVGYVLRHRNVVRHVRSLVARGAIGEPTSFQVMLGSYGTILAATARFGDAEANRLYRDYSHEWDYIRWILGPIQAVLAVARTTRSVERVEHPNLVDGLLRIDENLIGAFHVDYAEPRGTRTLHIVGTGGTLFADIGAGTIGLRGRTADTDRTIALPQTPAEVLQAQASHLLAVAAGTEQPAVGLADGLAALAVAESALRSAESGQWTAIGTEELLARHGFGTDS